MAAQLIVAKKSKYENGFFAVYTALKLRSAGILYYLEVFCRKRAPQKLFFSFSGVPLSITKADNIALKSSIDFLEAVCFQSLKPLLALF